MENKTNDLSIRENGSQEQSINYINENTIGKRCTIETPFGSRRMLYCDYTASARALKFIEDYIQEEVLPTYGNTHTTTSTCGSQTTKFRKEARSMIKQAVHAIEGLDEVLFVGNGVTGAVNLVVKLLFGTRTKEEVASSAVVFVGPFEHHSNLLPWRESGAKVVNIQEDMSGRYGVDLEHLEQQLQVHADYKLKIGTFSAASNLSGILTDTDAVTKILKKHGAYAFWDCASSAPYCVLDMNSTMSTGVQEQSDEDAALLQKDALFISSHKMVGGVGGCGVLVIKREILVNAMYGGDAHGKEIKAPTIAGGGTVYYVNDDEQRYVDDVEEREEAGTPNILGSIRAGLAFQVKESIGAEYIQKKEIELASRVLARLRKNPNIVICGNAEADGRRLPIISLNIKSPHPKGYYLHYGFVCALLNDLFGIQVRGGCVCAGPYGHRVLNISQKLGSLYAEQIKDHEKVILKPGFVRVTLNYVMSDEEVEYVCAALEFIARDGWKFLPQYTFEGIGAWKHRNYECSEKSLGKFANKLSVLVAFNSWSVTPPPREFYTQANQDLFKLYLQDAKDALGEIEFQYSNSAFTMPESRYLLSGAAEVLRFFLLPEEGARLLSDGISQSEAPFEVELQESISESAPISLNPIS